MAGRSGQWPATLPAIWVEDLVDAIMAAADSDRFDGSVLNLVDPDPLTQDDLAKYYLAATGKRKSIVHFPLSLLYSAGIRGGSPIPAARPQCADHAVPPPFGDWPPGIRLHRRRGDARLATARRCAGRLVADVGDLPPDHSRCTLSS